MSTPPPDSPSRSRGPTVAAWLVFAAVAVASTWPLVAHLATALPLGDESVPTVPLFNLWTVWWNADRAALGFEGYWDAPIFHPTRGTFVLSEAQPNTVVVAPLIWLSGRPVLGYNVYLLVSLWLNGGLTYRLLRQCGLRRWPAVGAGVVVQVLPFLCWQLGVLQLTQLWPTLWLMGALVRWSGGPRWRTAVEIGLAFALTYVTCNYYGLFVAMLLAPAGLWLLRRPCLTVRGVAQIGLAGLLAAALVWPIVSVQRKSSAEHRWEREEALVIELSAHLRDYSDTPWSQWLGAWEIVSPGRTDVWVLGPGWLKLIAAGVGGVLGLCFAGRRRWTLLVLTFGGLAVLFSLGPTCEFWNLSPYRGLREHLPGLGQIRSPFRFAVFVQLAVAFLCGETLQRLHPQGWWPRVAERCGRWRTVASWLSWLPMFLLGAALIAETLPPPQRLHQLAGPDELPLWVTFLRDETPAQAPVICLPVPLGIRVQDYEVETRWMVWQIHHGHPLLNGYSGYFPDSYVQLNGDLDHFPDRGVPRLLDMGARFAVVDRTRYPGSRLERHPATRDWEWVFTDGQAGIDIYRLPETLAAEFDSPASALSPANKPDAG